jgi:hypothetical protein
MDVHTLRFQLSSQIGTYPVVAPYFHTQAIEITGKGTHAYTTYSDEVNLFDAGKIHITNLNLFSQ